MFCSIPRILQSSFMNFDVNCGSLSLMNREGNLNRENTCFTYSLAISSAMAVSLQGIKTTAFVQSWSVTVNIESHPSDLGSLVMRSMVTTSKGVASGLAYMGCNGALVGRVLTFIRWHSAHPLTYCKTSVRSRGHQYCCCTNSMVRLIPG